VAAGGVGIKEIPARLAELKKLTEDNPEQQRRLGLLEEQINIELSPTEALGRYTPNRRV
jgi:CHASE3 domain sensor protein